jgi:hypothetical protein
MTRRQSPPAAQRFHLGLTEHDLQVQCVRWFAWQYPALDGLLFAIPNGGHRNKATAGRLKAEGVRAGVADLFLAVPFCNELEAFFGLFLECKLPQGRQSEEQKIFQARITARSYQYRIFRSLEEFQSIITQYLPAAT